MECEACRGQLPDAANFCPNCGTAVGAPGVQREEERRVVTVLFADMVGYTGLAEFLDPERVKRIIDDAFEPLIADIVRFGGRVDKLLGDGILALFGAPVAHEDDPDRAVHAALAMQASLGRFVEEHPDIEHTVQLRIGVNTGEVLVGRVGGTDDYTALGDVVNLASRLQTLAPPGGVYVGASTAGLVSADVVLEEVDELIVRGRAQSERVWNVKGSVSSSRARRLRSELPFIGRTKLRAEVGHIMDRVAAGNHAILSVVGAPGMGKTRFVNESIANFPGQRPAVLAGVCSPYGEASVWSPITTALVGSRDTEQFASAEQVHSFVVDRATRLFGLEANDAGLPRLVDAALYLTGHPSTLDSLAAAAVRERLFRFVVEMVRRRSGGGPVVLWIDDLQWADPLLIELLRRVALSIADRPVLIVTAQRHDAVLDWPPQQSPDVVSQIALEPLSESESATLAGAIIGATSNDRAAQLFERSGGNPLFLTELAALAEADATTTLPGSLQALIAARLDRLPSSARAIVDNAAVLGARGPIGSLRVFASKLGQPWSPDDLVLLDDQGILRCDTHTWHFESDVVREVAYQTLTKRARAERHGGTAALMSTSRDVEAERVAHHSATAAELVAEIGPVPGIRHDIATVAIDQLTQATRDSLDTGAFNQAIRHATRAINLGVADSKTLRTLELLRSTAATERREVHPARQDTTSALESALADGDRHDEAVARRLLGNQAQIAGDLVTARTELSRSIEMFRELGDDRELAVSLSDRGFIEVFGGSLRVAEQILNEAGVVADRLHDRRASAWIVEHLAWVAFLSGDGHVAEQRLTAAETVFEELGDRSGQSWAKSLRAYLAFMDRDFVAAEQMANEVRDQVTELGERWSPAMMDSLLASLRLWTGRFDEAEQHSSRALTGFRELGDRFGLVQALAPRARALVALGRTHDAEQALEEMLALSDSFGDLSYPMIAAAGTAAHLGLGSRAVAIAEEAVERMQRMGADPGEVPVTLALGLCQVGRADEALAILEGMTGDFPYLLSVRSLAAAMTHDHHASLSDAHAVWSDEGSSYLDRVTSGIAAASSSAHLASAADATSWIERSVTLADEVGDEIAKALVRHVEGALLEQMTETRLNDGWRYVATALATA